MSNRRRAKRPAMEPMQLDVLVVDHAGETAYAQSIPLDMPAFLFEKEMTYNVSVLLNPRKDAAAVVTHHLGIEEPRNRLGFTEAEWNRWRDESDIWKIANPEPRHQPYEDCTCTDIPTCGGPPGRGHCAAVGGDIVPWAGTLD